MEDRVVGWYRIFVVGGTDVCIYMYMPSAADPKMYGYTCISIS